MLVVAWIHNLFSIYLSTSIYLSIYLSIYIYLSVYLMYLHVCMYETESLKAKAVLVVSLDSQIITYL